MESKKSKTINKIEIDLLLNMENKLVGAIGEEARERGQTGEGDNRHKQQL